MKVIKKQNLDAINIYYRDCFAEIGGIDTMTYNLLKKYSKKKDILVLYGSGHIKQLKRLNEVGRLEKYDERRVYHCKKCFITYESLVPDNIIADTYARVSHGDLIEITKHGWKLPKDEKVTEDYGVSRNTCESVKKVLGKDAIYCPNPFIDEPVKPLLKLISPQRMTWEKGKDRIKEIARQLDINEIPYQWLIVCNYEDEVKKMDNPNLIWVKSRLDIKPFIKDADYLVLVSECEGSPMSPQEALMCGTPIIVTDLPCYKDLNINKNHGFFLKKDLSNLDVIEIYRKKDSFKFKWMPPQDIWGDILLDGKPEKTIKEYKPMKLYKVKATAEASKRGIKIAEFGEIPKENDEFEVPEDRLTILLGMNKYKAAFIKDAKAIEEEKPMITDAKIIKKKVKPSVEVVEEETTSALDEIMNKSKKKK